MTKTGVNKAGEQAKAIHKILITQPRPESDKSPYFELSRKYSIELDFHPFIRLEGIPAREFRKLKIEIQHYTGVIFTSRNAIDHFFRMCEEMKVTMQIPVFNYCSVPCA
jgi:uroporphyrinogen-III synthase